MSDERCSCGRGWLNDDGYCKECGGHTTSTRVKSPIGYTTRRCPAVGLTGQCTRPYERYGHQDGPHDPPDACYFEGPAHPASYYNED